MDTLPVQPLPRDATRLVAAKKPAAPKQHPAAKAAADSWANLHGAKFHANAMKRKK